MENDVLKNKIVPWQKKGRWYHAKMNETGLLTDLSDEFCVSEMELLANTQYYRLKTDQYYVIDYELIFNNFSTTTNRTFDKSITLTAAGLTQAIGVRADQFDNLDLDIYFYIVKKPL